MIIDLRSDTVTRPTAAMREAMLTAQVGDDVFGEDPTINALQAYAADLFGMEAALFCSSGTQTNQLAIAAHTHPGDEVICSELAHVYLYEGGGIALNSGCSVRLLSGDRGMFTAESVLANINNPADVHLPLTRLVCVEDTVNKGGGAVWDPVELERIAAVCREKGLQLHCDGARVFNALAVTGMPPRVYGALFDSISICLSKGLGAPVGSLLIGKKEMIQKAHRRRKSMGGGMRQAGIIAAGGLFALRQHVDRLGEDHRHANEVAAVLPSCSFVRDLLPVETNIVIFSVREGLTSAAVVEALKQAGILCFPFGPDKVRFVFHLDIHQDHVQELLSRLPQLHI